MASKLSFLNLPMERRKPQKDNKNKNKNELAFVKAAAWAWYQHNSGSKGKTITEIDAATIRREPRPSRYKLEAVRMAKEEEAPEGSTVHAKKLSLLDEYEVQSISRQLNGLVQYSSDNKLVKGGSNSTKRRVQKKKVKKGFWLRHGVVCGRDEDVVDPSALRHAPRLPPK